jgi:acetyl-CoA carboxylase alpha subunit
LEQLIKQIREDVEKTKEHLFKICEDRANKLAADISSLERKTQLSFVEINNELQSVEEVQCQRTSEARVSQADITTKLVEHKQGFEKV